MLPFRHVGPAKTEQWAGLIDAVYAIAMTVLALILPDILSECVRLLKHTLSAQYAWIGLYFIAFYFFAFLILYETWCFHRCLLTALPSNNRKQSIYTSLLLGVICLMPPLAAVTFKDIEMTQFWQKLPVSESIYSLGLLLWAISYLLIYLIAKKRKEDEAQPILKTISKGALRRSLFLAILFLYHIIEAELSPLPHISIVPIMVVYFLISFNQDKFNGVFRRS